MPCIRVGHLTENQQRLLRLALNRLGEKGEWDISELRLELKELILSDEPVEISGFAIAEIDELTSSDDLLDAFCYGIALALGDRGGF